MQSYSDLVFNISRSFAAWEVRGRGWQLSAYPCELEPPYRPFVLLPFQALIPTQTEDEGKRHTLISAGISHVKTILRNGLGNRREQPSSFEEPHPAEADWAGGALSSIKLHLFQDEVLDPKRFSELLLALGAYRQPSAFELVSDGGKVGFFLTVATEDAKEVQRLIQSFFPSAYLSETADPLASLSGASTVQVLDLGLENEFFLPINTSAPNAYLSLLSAICDLGRHEFFALQVLFQRTFNPWQQATLDAVGRNEYDALLEDAPEFIPLAKEKVKYPFMAVSLRVAVGAHDRSSVKRIAQQSLRPFLLALERPASNRLLALLDDEYEEDEQQMALLGRFTFRSGMLLSLPELAALVRFPDQSFASTALGLQEKRLRPIEKQADNGLYLGDDGHGHDIVLPDELRTRHLHILGATGTGKSTLISSLVLQDIENGHGVCLLDPHGDLADDILRRMPEGRLDDVIVFDPTDVDAPVPLNILEAKTETEKIVLSSDLTAILARESSTWGDNMTSVLSNAILSILEHRDGGTLHDLRRLLIDADFRKSFLTGVQDEEVRFFWDKQFPLIGARSLGPLLTRLDTFLRPKIIRAILGQKEGSLNLGEVLNERKILIAKLSQGLIGEGNSHLLGALLLSKIQQAARSRQAASKESRHPFHVYVDECQHFVLPSINEMLSGVRKYGLSLTLSHQYMGQLDKSKEFKEALLSNAHTRIVFRVAEEDARALSKGLNHFSDHDLQNLALGEAVVRFGESAKDYSLRTKPLSKACDDGLLERVLALSRQNYGKVIQTRLIEVPESIKQPEPIVRAVIEDTKVVPLSARSTRKDTGRPVATSDVSLEMEYGKGGREHKYLQHLIKRLGEERGYLASIEADIKSGRVDVVLSKEATSLAFEISVANSPSYEVQNLRKCLSANFSKVAFVSNSKQIAKVIAQLAVEEIDRIKFMEPEGIAEFLDGLTQVTQSVDHVVKGYKVKIKRQSLSSAELAGKRAVIAEVVARSLVR